MTLAALHHDSAEIVVEDVFPHAPETIWRTLTTGDLMKRWFMAPSGLEPVVGNRFTFQTKPAGAWDGTIHCEVLEVVPLERFAYRWRGGHIDNEGYGSLLDTIVTWTLSEAGSGTRLRLVHSGFVTPRNASALKTMGEGWKTVLPRLGEEAGKDF
ncbi:MAG: SRPBCC domain-containing protein [Alphaproteobacteria bacterium]|nr:SRPBCC domain-containing protein [Alphaproteobacteria bacterium]MBO6863781.1 SRPBCC domain-containing protein [Alphaproteobacteria bacterium]